MERLNLTIAGATLLASIVGAIFGVASWWETHVSNLNQAEADKPIATASISASDAKNAMLSVVAVNPGGTTVHLDSIVITEPAGWHLVVASSSNSLSLTGTEKTHFDPRSSNTALDLTVYPQRATPSSTAVSMLLFASADEITDNPRNRFANSAKNQIPPLKLVLSGHTLDRSDAPVRLTLIPRPSS